MQTFLPYPDFKKSASALDYRRCGKQRVEAEQIRLALTVPGYGWTHHPAVVMWRDFQNALIEYRNTFISEWVGRGYKNTMPLLDIPGEVVYPSWLGDEGFHASHRSNLLRKDPGFYSRFMWKEPMDLPYVWPL
jgi:hypothetical protein